VGSFLALSCCITLLNSRVRVDLGYGGCGVCHDADVRGIAVSIDCERLRLYAEAIEVD